MEVNCTKCGGVIDELGGNQPLNSVENSVEVKEGSICRVSKESLDRFNKSNRSRAVLDRLIELMAKNNVIGGVEANNVECGEGLEKKAYLAAVKEVAMKNRHSIEGLIKKCAYEGHILDSGDAMLDVGYKFRIGSLVGAFMVGLAQSMYSYNELTKFRDLMIPLPFLNTVPGMGLSMMAVSFARYWFLSSLELKFKKEVEGEVGRREGILKENGGGASDINPLKGLQEIERDIDNIIKGICFEDKFDQLFEVLVKVPLGLFVLEFVWVVIVVMIGLLTDGIWRRNSCPSGSSWLCVVLGGLAGTVVVMYYILIAAVLLYFLWGISKRLYVEVGEWLELRGRMKERRSLIDGGKTKAE